MSQGYSGPPQSSGGGGGTIVVIILVVAAALGLGCLGVCGLGFFGFAFTARQAGQPLPQAASSVASIKADLNEEVLVATATAAIVNDVRVKAALGEPISVEGAFDRPHQVSGIEHLFDLPVTGPKGTASAHLEGQQGAVGWEITALKVTLSGGDAFDIDPNQPFTIPLDAGDAPVLPPEITAPPQSPDPVPGEPTP